MPKYSIVVPVYNSEKTLEKLYERIKNVFTDRYEGDFELILVDDSSKDNSAKKMHELRNQDKRVKTIYLAKNFGQHKALICGFNHVKGDIIITLDDDLQHPPEEIPKMLDYLSKHPETDVVCGSYEVKKHSMLRNLGTTMTNAFTSYIFGKPAGLHMTSFRVMKKYVVESLLEFTDSRPRIGHMLLCTTNRIANVQVRHESRQYGRSGYSFKQLIRDFTNNILYNSNLPLKILGLIGAIDILFSIVLSLYYLIRYFVIGYSVEGFATQVILILVSSGLILFGQGIVGHYLSQIVSEAKKMPTYIIREKATD